MLLMLTKRIDRATIPAPHNPPWKLAAILALAALLAGCGREKAEAPVDEISESVRQPQAAEAQVAASKLDTTPAPASTAAADDTDAKTAASETTGADDRSASAAPASDSSTAALDTEDGQPAAAEPVSIRERYRAFHEYEQKFKAEDPVSARLTAENQALSQTISSNQTVITKRLQKDPEWNRIRKELGAAQQARDKAQRERALQRRSLVLSNAMRRGAIKMPSDKKTPASSKSGN